MITTDLRKEPVVYAQKSTTFSMEASGKMFKMVMSGLYSRKAESITREIWSNAFDAHSMAGCPEKPFNVSLPSRFNLQFSCRDYGEGLSDEWMNEKYTLVGFSAKEDTNLAVGKWGVGRMSPTAYTDTFTVTSVHKGKKAVYNITVGSDGSPSLNTFVPPTPTDEPSGLEISFPINPSDVGEFESAAKKVALGFDVKPLVDGLDYKWTEVKKLVQGDGYYFYECPTMSGPRVKMGCVIYPINTGLITKGAWCNYKNILVEIPIGSAEVTASREDLSYGKDEVTTQNLNNIFGNIRDKIVKDTLDSVSKAKSLMEANEILVKSTLTPEEKRDVKWKGYKVLPRGTGAPNFGCDIPLFEYSYRAKNPCGTQKVSSGLIYKTVVKAVYQYYDGGPKRDIRASTRIKSHLTLSRNEVALVDKLVWDKESKTYSESEIDKYKEIFGDITIIKVSDIDDKGAVKRQSNVLCSDLNWNKKEVDLSKKGYYYKSYQGNVTDLNYLTSLSQINKVLAVVDEDKFKNAVIVPKTHWKKFEESDNWEYAPDVLKKWFDSKKDILVKYLEDTVTVHDDFGLGHFINDGRITSSGNLKLYYDIFNNKKVLPYKLSHNEITTLLKNFGATIPKSKKDVALKKLADIIKLEYPLLIKANNLSDKQMYIDQVEFWYQNKRNKT